MNVFRFYNLIVSLCVMTLVVPSFAQLQVPTTLPDGFHLVWNDEFDIPGRPNPANWTYEEGFVRNQEWQWYQSDNAEVSADGTLVITARNESRVNPHYRPSGRDWRTKRDSIECTSACVISKGRKEMLYGRLLVRARIPAARGSWPAIWLLGSRCRYGWPSCGEIDVMEFYPYGGVRSILANACWGGERGNDVWDTMAIPFTHFTEKDPLWSTRFHIWRMDWDKDFIRIYLDDELLNEVDLSKTVNGKHGDYENPFHKPMYLLLNLAMGSRGGKVDVEAMPMRFEIDYVRWYQRKEDF